MTPEQAIAMLDRQLRLHGEDVLFMRGDEDEQAMPGFVRGYKAAELVGLLQQGDRSVVVSPTSFGAFGPPRAQDKAKIAESLVTIISVDLVRLAGVIVRGNLVVRGD